MAKKSARSKGYRKTVTKKPYLTKKDIIWTVVIIAVLVLAIVLFNLLYDDGSLKVVDGVVQTEGVNSLVFNDGSANNPRYFKLGQLSDVEGYTLTSSPIGSDENVVEYTYTPADESPIDSITCYAYPYAADVLSNAMASSLSSSSGLECSEMQTMESNDHTVYYFTYRAVPSQAEDAADATDGTTSEGESATEPTPTEVPADSTVEPEATEALADSTAESEATEAPADSTAESETTEAPADSTAESEATEAPQYAQVLDAYVSVGERCIIISVRNDAESEADYVDDSILTDALNAVIATLTYETK